MPFVEVNGVKINYLQIPCEAGEACDELVMIHGLATNMAFWYFSHAESFSKRYRVTLYDLRGHGRSGVTEGGYTAKNMALDLEQLLDHLGISRAHFVVHSYGGAVALNLACKDPARFSSLTLVDTHISAVRRLHNNTWKFEEKIKTVLRQNHIHLDSQEPNFGFRLLIEIARLKVKNVEITRELDNLISPLMGKNSKRTASRWLRLIETTRAETELMADDGLSLESLRTLTFPILAMYGERSQSMTTGEQLLEVWPHADFRRIRESGHCFPITRPSDFLDTCRFFWRGGMVQEVPRRECEFIKKYFRANRFYSRSGKWFFDTREEKGHGPFNDIEEAKEQLLDAICMTVKQGRVE